MRLNTVFALSVIMQGCSKQPPSTVAPISSSNVQAMAAADTNRLTQEQAEALLPSLAHSLSQQQIRAVIRSLTKADLPTNATEMFGYSRQLFTELIDIRFTCTSDELRAFLSASPHLPDDLPPRGLGVLHPDTDFPWWRPKELKNTRGSRDNWKFGADTIVCSLLAGDTVDPQTVTVYLSFVLETTK